MFLYEVKKVTMAAFILSRFLVDNIYDASDRNATKLWTWSAMRLVYRTFINKSIMMNLQNNEVWTNHVVMGFQPIKYRDFPYGVVIPDNIRKAKRISNLSCISFKILPVVCQLCYSRKLPCNTTQFPKLLSSQLLLSWRKSIKESI